MKRITLFGGEGFIGQNLIDHLKSKYECFSLSRKRSLFHTNIENFIEYNPYTQPWNDKSDVYIHLIDNKEYDEESLARNIFSGTHLILFSSAVIYANPSSEYGIRKAKLEAFYNDYCRKHKIDLTILRLFNIYGYYQIPFRQGSLIANIFYNHINGIPTKINNLQVMRDFIFASDVAEIIKNVIENKMLGTYDLATGTMRSIGELIKVINCSINDNVNIMVNEQEDIACPQSEGLIPYVMTEEFQTTIVKTFRFYQENRKLIERIISL